MGGFAQDLRHTVRALIRDPGFTAAVVVTLAVGVGVNTAVFGIVRSTLLEPLPYQQPDRLAMVWTTIADRGIGASTSAYANILDWRDQNRVFADLATFDPLSLTLSGGEWPEQISTARVSANLFSVLGVTPAIGRTFTREEEQRQAAVVVLSHSLWQRRFNGSSDVIGQTIEIGGATSQVIGVMADGFGFPDADTELWLPQTLFSDWDTVAARRGTDAWRVVGQLRPGVSVEEANDEMGLIAARLEQSYPIENAGLGAEVVPLRDQVTGTSYRFALWTLFGAVGLVLLIACANVAHLFLVRGMGRAQELAIRVALGATMPRLIRKGITESLVVSVASAFVGLFLAVAGLEFFLAVAPPDIPRLDEVGIDPAVFTYGVIVSLASGVLFGIAPALSHSRGAGYGALREGWGRSQRIRGGRLRRLLIAGQFAMAIILVFGANLLIRSFVEARRVDLGFDSDDILIANLSVEPETERVSFYEQVVQEVQTIPGVRAVGIVEDLFISGAPNQTITIDEDASVEPRFEPLRIDAIGGDLFQAMGVPIQAGRGFSQADGAGGVPVALINETMEMSADRPSVKVAQWTMQALAATGGLRVLYSLDLPDSYPETLESFSPQGMATLVEEFRALPSTLAQDQRVSLSGSLPVVVLTGGQSFAGLPDGLRERADSIRMEMQRELAAYSENSDHRIISGARHYIQLDDPEAVIGAITDVITAVREDSPVRTSNR